MSTDEDERYRSRKWILFTRTLIGASAACTGLVTVRLLGVETAPDVSSILNFWGLLSASVLGGYGAVNLIGKGK
ncbi:MAG TPA: hypothetical protein VMW79_07890 [Anaerolineae bacterium]|nr:hypothetical protein [Anaerolineae bacterium]